MQRTIPTFLRNAVNEVPDRKWLVAGDRRWTYGEALSAVERAAAGLRAFGIGRGDRVVVTARNEPEDLLTWFALMDVGAVEVPVNPESTVAELTGFVRQVEAAAVLTAPDDDRSGVAGRVATAVKDAGATGVPVVALPELFDADADGRGPAGVEPDDVAVMIPTSGTTGQSKLVMQTHRAYVMAGEGFPWWLGLTENDRLMTALPLFHINAPAYSVLGSVAARASVVLLPRFSASGFLDAARRYGATQFNAIGAMLEILMRQPARADDADNPLRLCYAGPSPAEDRHLEIEARFGFEIVCGYGLSEAPYGLIWPRGSRPYGTLGAPRQHPELGHVNDARVLDGDREVGPGEVGELWLRNPAVMAGYYEMPEETAEVVVDGWLRTGDLVQVEGDGTYTFVGRRKEVIRRRGENLSPTEVEAVVERHPGVAEAAVVGVPSDLTEEDIKAFVVPAGSGSGGGGGGGGDDDDGGGVDVADLHAFAARHLSAFKVPRYWEVVGELPHTPTGRVAKHQLPRDRTAGEVDMETEQP